MLTLVIALGLASVLTRQLGLRGFGFLSPRLYVVGEIGRWLAVVLAYAAADLISALVLAGVLSLVAPIAADLVLFPKLHKGSMTTFRDFRSIVPRTSGPDPRNINLADLEARMMKPDPRDQQLVVIERRAEIATVLARRGKPPGDLIRIEHALIRMSLGYRIPRKIVSTAGLLEEFYDLEEQGAKEGELVRLYLGRFGWVT
jgi:hypothetical protein